MKRVVRSVFQLCAFALFGAQAFAQLSFNGTLEGFTAGTTATGTGTAYGTFSADLKSVTYQVTVAGLTGPITAAHFHIAPKGTVVHPIAFTGNTATGTWSNIPDSLLAYFIRGDMYINVHTAANPNGEIRAAIHPSQFLFTVNLDGAQAGTNSTARGTGFVQWGDTLEAGTINTLFYSITITGLNGKFSASHFHVKPSGTIVHPITFTDSTAMDLWSGLPDSLLTLLLHGKVYVNIHSSTNPNGEIAGVLTPVGEMPFTAALDGAQAGTPSTGRGTAFATLSANGGEIRYSATYGRLVSPFAAAHFHTTVGGKIIHPVTFANNTTKGTWTAPSDTNLQDLLRGRVYLNVHSSTYPNGEIRGNLRFFDGTFTAMLDGAQAGTSSSGTGTAWLHLGAQKDTGIFQATWTGLSGTYSGSHFHLAPSGTIIKPITSTDSTTGSGVWNVPDSIIVAILHGDVYVNVHSSTFPGGDIRGTITAGFGNAVSVRQIPDVVPSAFTLEQNYPNPFNPSTTIRFTIAKPEFVTLTVYDLLGQRVATLMSETRSAGSYEVTFDASKYASGMYVYMLRTTSGLGMARKMILMK